MSYLDLFNRVARFIEGKGIAVEFERGRRISDRIIASARRKSPLPVPESLVEFYREMGNGMRFYWHAGKPIPPTPEQIWWAKEISKATKTRFEMPTNNEKGTFACVEFLPFMEQLKEHQQSRSFHMRSIDKNDYSVNEDPRRAKRTAIRRLRWLAFMSEGNGDEFCVDTNTRSNRVVFNRHDWHHNENGFPLGTTLADFMKKWATVCFQEPSSLYWPSVLSRSGVNWNSKDFDRRLRLPR